MMSRRNLSLSIPARYARSASHWLGGSALTVFLVVLERQLAGRADADLVGADRRLLLTLSHHIGILTIENPALGHRHDRFALLADALEILDHILQGFECRPLPAARGHLSADVGNGIAQSILNLPLVELRIEFAILTAPAPGTFQPLLDHLGLSAKHDLRRAHTRCHQGDEVVVRQVLPHEPDERLGDRVCALPIDVGAVEEDQEDASPGIRQRLHHVALRARLGAGRVWTDGRHDVLEGLDLLRHAILEHLEVGGLKSLDDPAILGRVGVDTDEVRADADRLLRLSREDH